MEGRACLGFLFKLRLVGCAQWRRWSPGPRPAGNDDDGDDKAKIINHTSAAS